LPRAEIFGPARVLEVADEGDLVRVLVAADDDVPDDLSRPRSAWARVALASPVQIGWGDTVLIAGQVMSDLYVIGLLGSQVQRSEAETERDETRELVLESGARAEVEGPPQAERLKVYSEGRDLLFEYDSQTGTCRIDRAVGDIQFVAQQGNVDFVASKEIRFFSRESIAMSSLDGIRLAAIDPTDQSYSAIDVGAGRVGIRSRELGVRSDRGKLEIERASYVGKRLTASIEGVELAMKRIESVAETVIQKAQHVYSRVDGLSQLVAGRARTLIQGAYQLKSKDAYLKAEKDFKVNGDKIHLG
jgi:hypothetical protein